MSLPLLAVAFLVVLVVGYRLYGGWVARQFGLDDCAGHARNPRSTTASTSSRRGRSTSSASTSRRSPRPARSPGRSSPARPSAGCPACSGSASAWCFIGAVHDFSSLDRLGAPRRALDRRDHARAPRAPRRTRDDGLHLDRARLRHRRVHRHHGGHASSRAREELAARTSTFNPGGAVAAASVLYLALALRHGPRAALASIRRSGSSPSIFVPATFAVAWLGTQLSTLLVLDAPHVGAADPRLLRRRLGGAGLGAAAAARATSAASCSTRRSALGVHRRLLRRLRDPAAGVQELGASAGRPARSFPFLFVTIACGACSGFHGLVCSGTTSKQIDRESHMPAGRLRRDARRGLRRADRARHGHDRRAGRASSGLSAGDDLRQRHRPLPDAPASARSNLPFADHLRRDGVLDLRLRHARRLHAPRALHRAGAVRLDGARRRGRRPRCSRSAVPAAFLARAGQGAWVKFWTLFGASNQLLAALTLLSMTRLAAPGRAALRLHAVADAVRARRSRCGRSAGWPGRNLQAAQRPRHRARRTRLPRRSC